MLRSVSSSLFAILAGTFAIAALGCNAPTESDAQWFERECKAAKEGQVKVEMEDPTGCYKIETDGHLTNGWAGVIMAGSGCQYQSSSYENYLPVGQYNIMVWGPKNADGTESLYVYQPTHMAACGTMTIKIPAKPTYRWFSAQLGDVGGPTSWGYNDAYIQSTDTGIEGLTGNPSILCGRSNAGGGALYCEGWLDTRKSYTVRAIPQDSFVTFDHWEGIPGCDTQSECTFQPAASVDGMGITARFKIN
jgi:hypothetical protein